ncbi:MAG: nuclear transport factor 2 family protein [Acidimicrobiaceae bacterium]|nr:nuclear transport factor 2 family protein [Acidimicrobiaceae bacterium]MBO0748743.1 nuclear transport factor 2 family protein [Acidimicrobiaceae bacterium]
MSVSEDKAAAAAGAGGAGEVVRRFFATLSTGDFDAIGEFFDDESVWTSGNVGRTQPPPKGRQAIIEDFLKPIRLGLFEEGDPKVEIQTLIVDGDSVAAETIGRGTMRNGAPYENQYAFVFQVAGDKIRFMKEYMDTAYAGRVTQAVRDHLAQG